MGVVVGCGGGGGWAWWCGAGGGGGNGAGGGADSGDGDATVVRVYRDGRVCVCTPVISKLQSLVRLFHLPASGPPSLPSSPSPLPRLPAALSPLFLACSPLLFVSQVSVAMGGLIVFDFFSLNVFDRLTCLRMNIFDNDLAT